MQAGGRNGMNSYLAKLTPFYLQLAEDIGQVPDSDGVVIRYGSIALNLLF